MDLIIFKDIVRVGTVSLDARSGFVFTAMPGMEANEFEALMKHVVLHGAPAHQEVRVDERTRFLTEELVSVNDALFPTALKEYLTMRGYRVVETTPELDRHILDLAVAAHVSPPIINNLQTSLPEMSLLGKTLIEQRLIELTNPASTEIP